MPTPVVTPRHAASVVIHRKGNSGTEVFTGHRHKKARFKPGVYVFPGGMIERADHDAPIRWLWAAVRETFEETGLVAGAPGDVGPSSHPTWSHFRKIGQAPDLSRLGLSRLRGDADRATDALSRAIFLHHSKPP